MDPEHYYTGKIVLVTGGVGSIGRVLVHELLKYNLKSIRVLDNNESGLFDLEQDLGTDKIRSFIGDIRDKERLMMAMEGVDIVFHAAALKHVPLCEYNPFDAIKTNILGTQNIIDAALEKRVKKVINISTDKAVNPTNVMGATKLLTERLITSAAYYQGTRPTIFANVRFGNVLNSRGSVIPLFKKQIQSGGPLTVTDPQMTRFCMQIPDAANLIIRAGIIAQGRETFILKMPAFLMQDMADAMRDYFGPKYGSNPQNIGTELIGRRVGEKLYEELMTEEEGLSAYENEMMYIIAPQNSPQSYQYNDAMAYAVPEGFRKTKVKEFSSKSVPLLNKTEIISFLKNCEDTRLL